MSGEAYQTDAKRERDILSGIDGALRREFSPILPLKTQFGHCNCPQEPYNSMELELVECRKIMAEVSREAKGCSLRRRAGR